MLEDPYEFTPQPDSRFWGWTLLGWLFIIGLFGAGLVYCTDARADPLYRASILGVVITLHSEECALKDKVSNLPRKATWVENGKTYQGCFGYVEPLGLFMFYFSDDKTVAGIPASAFSKVHGV